MKQTHKLKFVTLFPNCPNFGLVKDVGQIPYELQNFGFECRLASKRIDMNGDYVHEYPLIINPLCTKVNDTASGILFLLRNARSIDILNLYHIRKQTYIWSRLYKFLNPHGHIYLKLDIDYVTAKKIETNKKYFQLFRNLTGMSSLISGESDSVANLVQQYSEKRIIVIPNGYAETKTSDNQCRNKENVFLTVGRIGTEQKATEVLLKAFAKIADRVEWNLKIIGPIENEFHKNIEEFFCKYPELKERVEFVGNISNRTELYKEYSKAKVFVLPSRWESFAIVLVEAIAGGCYIIASDKVPSAKVITAEERYGKIVPVDDVRALADAMFNATGHAICEDEIRKYAQDNFSWNSICCRISEKLKDICR